jgi:hypothetical protein
MSDPMVMQISNATEHLLEETELVFLLQVLSFDQGIQFAILAVLHHMIPAACLCAKANSPDNVRMIQRFGDAVLRLDLSDVFCLALVGRSFAEFFDRVLITLRLPSSDHNLDRRCSALANFFPTAKFGGRYKLGIQLARFDIEILGKVGARTPSLNAGSLSGVQ